MPPVCDRSKPAVGHRDQILADHAVELGEWIVNHPPLVVGQSRCGVRYRAMLVHHDHRLRFARCDQIVQDEILVPLIGPSAFVFAHTVLQIEHGVARIWFPVIVGRRIDKNAPPLVCALREVPLDAGRAVWDVSDSEELRIRTRYLDSRCSAAVHRRTSGFPDRWWRSRPPQPAK